jgi:hypothetical protein
VNEVDDALVEELRKRIGNMTDTELLRFQQAPIALSLLHPGDESQEQTAKLQFVEARAEWKRRHGAELLLRS